MLLDNSLVNVCMNVKLLKNTILIILKTTYGSFVIFIY